MNTDKLILDACCGGRTFWFDKKHPDTLYIDNEPRSKGICKERPEFNCTPDIVMDFRQLPFAEETFWHIVWDPPHLLNLMATSIMRKKYGTLQKETWQADMQKGFDELWRVLKTNGTLVFKWSEGSIPVSKVLSLFPETPLYGHPTAKHGKTKWMVFVKTVKTQQQKEAKASGVETLRTPPTSNDVGIRAGDIL